MFRGLAINLILLALSYLTFTRLTLPLRVKVWTTLGTIALALCLRMMRRLRKCYKRRLPTLDDYTRRYAPEARPRISVSMLKKCMDNPCLDYLGHHPALAHMARIQDRPRDDIFLHAARDILSAADYDEIVRWHRNNPTLPRCYSYLLKFAKKQVVCPDLIPRYRELMHQNFVSLGFFDPDLLASVREHLVSQDFENLKFDPSSAVGLPLDCKYNRKRDAFPEAAALARQMMEQDPTTFPMFWRTAGRGKLHRDPNADTARMVEYLGFQWYLIFALYTEPITQRMVSNCGKTSSFLGHSWFHKGAQRLFDELHHEDAHYWNADISGWDASVQPELLTCLRDEHLSVIRAALGENHPLLAYWIRIISYGYENLINSVIVMPDGHAFMTHQGMKSGWNMTSVDNTLLHMPIVQMLFENLGAKVYKSCVYGDDNLTSFVMPPHVDENTFVKYVESLYAAFGFTLNPVSTLVKDIHSVNFLMKRFTESSLGVFPTRDPIENYIRLAYPDVYSLHYTTGPLHTAQRIAGHYIDNFCEPSCRETLRKILKLITSSYGLGDFHIIPRRYLSRLSSRDQNLLGNALPTDSKIAELYGYPLRENDYSFAMYTMLVNDSLAPPSNAPSNTDPLDYRRNVDIVNSFSEIRDSHYSKSQLYAEKRRLNPWKSRIFGGNAGLKIADILNKLSPAIFSSIKFVLDIGGHPGSMINAYRHYMPDADITSISLIPNEDVRADRPPWYKVADPRHVTQIVADAYSMENLPPADLVVIDTSPVSDEGEQPRSEAATIFNEKNLRLISSLPSQPVCIVVRSFGFHVDELNGFLRFALTHHYALTVHKPIGSYPWNNEVYMVFCRMSSTANLPSLVSCRKRLWAALFYYSGLSVRWSLLRSSFGNDDVPPDISPTVYRSRLGVG
uniref:RdRp catalytic domain-containing protein n=1 Tax=Cryptotermes domesticus cupavirus 2 TaxID=3133539 RepID=A0AAT9JF90_9VIRU